MSSRVRPALWAVFGAGFLLGGAALAVAQHASAEAPAPARRQAERMSEQARKAALEHAAGLQNRLAVQEAETFGGLWIERSPRFRVVVAFTRTPAQTLRRYTLNGLFEPRLAKAPLREMIATQDRLSHQLRAMGVASESETDVRRGRVRIVILSDPEEVQAAAASGALKLPDYVELVQPPPLAVAAPAPPTVSEVKAFPRWRHRSGAQMAALAIGTLAVEDGCLRLRGRDGATRLLIWPGEASLTAEGGRPGVLDRTTGDIIPIGVEVALGGGEIGAAPDAALLDAAIPDVCEGPYWAVSTGFQRAEPTPAA